MPVFAKDWNQNELPTEADVLKMSTNNEERKYYPITVRELKIELHLIKADAVRVRKQLDENDKRSRLPVLARHRRS